MGLIYENLDDTVRNFMAAEIDIDIEHGSIYLSNWLTEAGKEAWPDLLKAAAESHDDDWLSDEIARRALLVEMYERRKPKGGTTMARVPVTAPTTMAEGEFNRYYSRGVCRAALERGEKHVEVYRAKEVSTPRPGSEEKIGSHVSASDILDDLRSTQGVEPALGLPPGPNSGLTLRLI